MGSNTISDSVVKPLLSIGQVPIAKPVNSGRPGVWMGLSDGKVAFHLMRVSTG